MPDYLVINVSNGRSIGSGGTVVQNAKSAHEAVAALFADDATYAYEQEFAVFDISTAERVVLQMEKRVTALDATDVTGTTVLATWGESELKQLADERATAEATP